MQAGYKQIHALTAYINDVITRIVEGHPQRRLDNLLPCACPTIPAL